MTAPRDETDLHLDDVSISDSAALLRRLGPMSVSGLYIHVPFCSRKCPYCGFYSVVADQGRREKFLDRLEAEMRAAARFVRGPVRTVYAGGGTPTLLGPALWGRLLDQLHDEFDLGKLEEFTVEANPETVEHSLMHVLAAGGVNRLSIGVQSFDPSYLATLGRRHGPEDVERAVRIGRAAGIDNITLDLMFGIPGQTLDEWAADLDQAAALRPDHLSCYGLAWEPDTPLAADRARGVIQACDDAAEAAMYEHAIDRLIGTGFEQYEISNFARPGRRCRHNMLYWTSANWLAFGPAGASHARGVRWRNVADLAAYVESRDGVPVCAVECLDDDARLGEDLMLALRLIEGAERERLAPRLDPRRARAIERAVADGLLERTDTHIRFTRRGLLLADSVLADLV